MTLKWQIILDVTHGSLCLLMMQLLLVMSGLVYAGFDFVFCYYDNAMIWCTCAYDINGVIIKIILIIFISSIHAFHMARIGTI